MDQGSCRRRVRQRTDAGAGSCERWCWLAPPTLCFKRLVIDQLPLYNRSMPGVLKNALDHASRPYGQNAWAGKPAGVIGVSLGASGTAMAQQHLRKVLAYLDVPTLGQPEAFVQAREGLFDAEGHIGTGSRPFMQRWMNQYVAWVQQHAA